MREDNDIESLVDLFGDIGERFFPDCVIEQQFCDEHCCNVIRELLVWVERLDVEAELRNASCVFGIVRKRSYSFGVVGIVAQLWIDLILNGATGMFRCLP